MIAVDDLSKFDDVVKKLTDDELVAELTDRPVKLRSLSFLAALGCELALRISEKS